MKIRQKLMYAILLLFFATVLARTIWHVVTKDDNSNYKIDLKTTYYLVQDSKTNEVDTVQFDQLEHYFIENEM